MSDLLRALRPRTREIEIFDLEGFILDPSLLAKPSMELSGQDAEDLWQVPSQVGDVEAKVRHGEESHTRLVYLEKSNRIPSYHI